VDEATNRFFAQSTYDVGTETKHTLSLSLSVSDRSDNSLRRQDVRNMTLATGIVSRFAFPLQTGADISVNLNRLPSGTGPGASTDFNYTTISVNGKYGVLNQTLQFTSAVSPTLGDFTYFSNKDVPDDNIWSFRYRYDL
jgi:hypothetical protein